VSRKTAKDPPSKVSRHAAFPAAPQVEEFSLDEEMDVSSWDPPASRIGRETTAAGSFASAATQCDLPFEDFFRRVGGWADRGIPGIDPAFFMNLGSVSLPLRNPS
jgi:hypothetical protein